MSKSQLKGDSSEMMHSGYARKVELPNCQILLDYVYQEQDKQIVFDELLKTTVPAAAESDFTMSSTGRSFTSDHFIDCVLYRVQECRFVMTIMNIGAMAAVRAKEYEHQLQQTMATNEPAQHSLKAINKSLFPPGETNLGFSRKRNTCSTELCTKPFSQSQGSNFVCKESQNTFKSCANHYSAGQKCVSRCLIAMFGTCNIQDTLTKSTRGRGGRGNNRGRGRGRGGGGGRGRPNYQTSSEWEANGPMRGNSRPVDYGSNGLIQRTPDWGGCDCGNRGRVRSNQGHQQRAYSTAWDDNYDNVSYNNQSGFVNHGGYSDDSATYIEPSTVTSNTYTNPNHYSNQNVYSDQSVSNTQGRSRSIGTGVNRVSVYERSSGGQGGYQQRIVGEQGWNKSGQSQGGGKGYQGGRGRGRGRGYQTH
ncbi:unnamed protein product, partial [Meganyctiphanes norvegica]